MNYHLTNIIITGLVTVSCLPALAQKNKVDLPDRVEIEIIEPFDPPNVDLRNNDKTLLNDVDQAGGAINKSRKWIGVLCRPTDAVLQTHLGLEEGVGLIVERVVPDSPADQANLKANDILVSVNDQDLTSIQILVEATAASNEQGLSIRCIRGGQNDIVQVQPVSRPAPIAGLNPGRVDQIPEMKRLRAWIEQLENGEHQQADAPMQFRFFGNGLPMPGNNFPNGNTQIHVERHDGGPARIKVERNGDTWEVTEDSLDELPDDIQKSVQGMLQGGGAGFPGAFPMRGLQDFPWPQFDRRLNNMDDQLQEMMDEIQKLRSKEEEDDSIDA